jgi:hypothetical protein
MNAARIRLSTIMRIGAPEIIRLLAEEAANASNMEGSPRRSGADEYEALIARSMPRVLDAVGADDRARAQMLESLAQPAPAVPVQPVPPLARVGLLSIGLKVSREHVERTVAGQAEAGAILAEFDLFAAALRGALSGLPAKS